MAKRTRGTGRPGQRRPTSRSARPAAATRRDTSGTPPAPAVRPSGSLTAEEEARAAELEERIRAEERAAEELERKARDRARSVAEGEARRARDATPLHVKAAAEYAYVQRDIVRILRMAVILAVIVAVLHVLINVTGTISV